MQLANVPPVQIQQLTGRAQWVQRISAVDDPAALPGATNYAMGGNLNAFIDAIEGVFQEGIAQSRFQFGFTQGGVGTVLGPFDVRDYVRVNNVDPNPAEGTGRGVELGDRIYVNVGENPRFWTASPWVCALYNGFWYSMPAGNTPLNSSDPWATPGNTAPHISGYERINFPAGIIPMPTGINSVLWQPGEQPTLQPNGVILEDPDFPTGGSGWGNGDENGDNGKAPAENGAAPAVARNWLPLALGAAALYFFMD